MSATSEALMTKEPIKEIELDLIEKAIKEIENLSLKDIVSMIPATVEDRGLQSFRLGGMLSRAKRSGSEQFFQTAGKSFVEWVESEIGFSKSKAYALANVYDGLADAEIAWADVADIGWTKLALIATKFQKAAKPGFAGLTKKQCDKRNADMIAAAREQSHDELQRFFAEKPKGQDKKPPKVKLELHQDQWETAKAAAEKVKKAEGHEGDNSKGDAYWIDAALQSYLNFVQPAKKPPTLANMMKAAGPEAALKTFEEIWPDIDVKAEFPH